MENLKPIRWNTEKNRKLLLERALDFEKIAEAILNDQVVDIIDHSNTKYGHQKVFLIDFDGYIVTVPYVETKKEIFLKTAFYNRKATKKYLGRKDD